MTRSAPRHLSSVLALCVVLGLSGATASSAGNAEPVTAPEGASEVPRTAADVVEKAREYFTDLPLVTHQGETVRFFSDMLDGKVVLINSFYTGCHGITPRQAQVLARLRDMLGERLGKDVFLVSITVDPANDTEEVVAGFAEELGAVPGWTFLTGKVENVDWVNHRLGQYLEDLEEHKGTYLLGNVATTLWTKLPAHAQPLDLLMHIEKFLGDRIDG